MALGKFALLALVPFLLFVGCVTDSQNPVATPTPGPTAIPVITATPVPTASALPTATPNPGSANDAQSITPGLDRFGLQFYSKLANSSKGNIFFSPFSIATAFAMVSEGARGLTASQIQTALGFPADAAAARTGYSGLLDVTNSPNPGYQLSTANAIWTQRGFDIKPAFISSIQDAYKANASELDLQGDPESSRKTINSWVSGRTNQKIAELLPEGSIDSSSVSVLVNAIYFKSTWQQQFDKTKTSKAPFYVDAEKTVQADMMYNEKSNSSDFYRGDGFTALSMGYSGGDLSMLILLPTSQDGLGSLENRLSPAFIGDVRSNLHRKSMGVYLPKFKFEEKEEISAITKSLGITDAFSDSANFSGISDQQLKITGAYHDAFVAVDEEGTEAAAATGIVISATAYEEDSEFIANHPFLFLIIDKRTDAILFMGRVADPTATG